MGSERPPSPYDPRSDFRKARHQILSGNLPDNLLSNEKHQFVALHLFRAVDLLRFKGIKSPQIANSAQHLRQIQDALLSQEVDLSLDTYSEGFVLGALVDALHRYEANINSAEKHSSVLNLLRSWRERLSDADTMSKFIDEALRGADELLHWSEDRSKALLPIGLEILKYFRIAEIPNAHEALGQITEAIEEKELFHFLAGSLQTKPSLHKAVFSECAAHEIKPEKFLAFLEQMMEQLRTSAKKPEVRGLANLFWTGYNSARTNSQVL